MGNLRCAHCGSFNTQTGVDKYHCQDCGGNTLYTGEAVPNNKRTEPRDLNEPYVQLKGHEFGSRAGGARTPDGVADPGTNTKGPIPKNQAEAVASGEQRDDDLMKGVPEPPPKEHDDRPVSMQTDRRAHPEEERSDVNEETFQDMQEDGGFPVKTK